MIRLIVGLGNPGRQYEETRHNAGFLFLDQLAVDKGVSWSNEPKFQGLVADCNIAGHKVVLLKPQAFMNRSGGAVGSLVRYYKIEVDEVLIVHDELDLAPGVVRLKKDGGHAGHNGLRDIIAALGLKGFYRLRVGVGRPVPGKSVADYVLSKPSKDEVFLMDESFDVAGSEVEAIVLGEMPAVMGRMNKK